MTQVLLAPSGNIESKILSHTVRTCRISHSQQLALLIAQMLYLALGTPTSNLVPRLHLDQHLSWNHPPKTSSCRGKTLLKLVLKMGSFVPSLAQGQKLVRCILLMKRTALPSVFSTNFYLPRVPKSLQRRLKMPSVARRRSSGLDGKLSASKVCGACASLQ
jgi:hypothetical protein